MPATKAAPAEPTIPSVSTNRGPKPRKVPTAHALHPPTRAGTATYSTVLSVRSLIAANQALLAPLEQNASQAEHLLAMLEGVVPSKANLPDIDLAELSLPADLPLSLPSDLVNQRPDILSSEALMHVASANIGIATAAMFPSFSLSGTYGGASTTLANLSAVSKFWSIGPTATTPVFQGNSLWYVRRASIDAYQQSQANYRQTVLGAFEQVADTLKALEHDAEGLQAQVEARRAAGEALNLLQVNYRAGLVAYPDVLAADVQFSCRCLVTTYCSPITSDIVHSCRFPNTSDFIIHFQNSNRKCSAVSL